LAHQARRGSSLQEVTEQEEEVGEK